MSNQKLKIVYMGTPDFAVAPLKALYEAGHEIVAVYSQPPRPAGRGKKITKSPVHEWAESHDIPVYTPANLKKDVDARTEFIRIGQGCDLGVVAAYGLILPKEVLDAPKNGCMNIHASLLPRWRGAAPIQYAIWKGDAQTGVTIMQMDIGLDTGDMLYRQACAITSDTTARSLHDQLSEIGARLIVMATSDLALNQLAKPERQDDSLSNYASMLKKEDGVIDWSVTADEVDRQVRALNPWPGTFVNREDGPLKIKSGEVVRQDEDSSKKQNAVIGQLLNKQGDVLCGQDTIYRLTTVQPAGKKAMDVASAINGGYLAVNKIV